MTHDERYERWVERLDRITSEVYNAHLYRLLWRELGDIVRVADLPPSVIFDSWGVWYATTQSSSIRRQVDRGRGVVSLYRLLSEVAQHPRVVSRERHVALWTRDNRPGDFDAPANENYDRFSDARERDVMNVAFVRTDIDSLAGVGTVIERYVDEAIAHTADRTTQTVPTYDELNAAIDTVADLVSKYASLLKAEILPQFEPAIQYDWKAPFRQAWIPDG